MDAIVLLVFPVQDGAALCGMLGVEAGTEDAISALGEIGNILSASYITALSAMTGLELDLTPAADGHRHARARSSRPCWPAARTRPTRP